MKVVEAAAEPLRVGLVGLGEAGNLGDDLILIATVDAVYEADPNADVAFLSFGQELDWGQLAEDRGYRLLPRRVHAKREIPLLRQNAWLYRDRDVIIFGGGGLLQTTHAIDRPYGWLSYLPKAGPGAPRVLATGLGIGPLSGEWVRRMRRMGTPFDLAWLRDPESLALARNDLGWIAEECRDFIDPAFLASWRLKAEPKGETSLGVALRAWPGFSVDAAVAHIDSIAERHKCRQVVFFVLEASKGRGVDVDFSDEVGRRIKLPSHVRPYLPHELTNFLTEMMKVDVAVSMKLHSSAIWAFLGIPMYPIFYAPKVAAFFGSEFRGFQVMDTVVPVPSEIESVPRANDTVRTGLRVLADKARADGSRIAASSRCVFQLKGLVAGVGRVIAQIRQPKTRPAAWLRESSSSS